MVMVLFCGMKEMLIPIDQAGRIVLPKGVREELAIKSGDKLKVSINGSSVTLTPTNEKAGFIRKGKAFVFSTKGQATLTNETVTKLVQAGREEREEATIAGLLKPKRAQ
jgi:AbrB family looped-hinge helix DNA binding protein